ncbi:MAG: redoxin domain-containing protein, partial [Sedimentisphaerales bacterium]|nr:redoxin domain-containing protein [Sedimentisphaerales bacterium]
GQFKFPHFMPSLSRDKVVLTVQAKGYGPELKVVPMRRDMEPVVISIDQPRTIRVQVVDANGNPVIGAGVDVDNWRGFRSLSWRSSTDESGRFVWNEAPADEVDIDIYKDGYMRVSNQFFTARDEEYKIVMLRPLVISGTVVAADTNEPIRDFTATRGINWGDSISWEAPNQAGYNGDFTNGKYKMTIDQPYPGHLVRIDAEGYLPAESRVFESNEGSVTYDFRLKKGSGPNGIVYDTNGLPAEGAKIYVVMPNKGLSFDSGRPTNQPQDNEWAVTNEDGAFSFKGLLEDSLYKLVILHDEGFAEVSKEQWLKDPNIALQKWGRVEGTLHSGLKLAANQGVYFYSTDTQDNPEHLSYSYSINAITNDKGHFVIEHAMAGKAAVTRKIVSDGGQRSSYSHTKHIEIIAGQTTKVDIGGGGRLVTGKLIKPEWATDTDIQNTNPNIGPGQTQINPYEISAGMEFPKPQRFDEMTVAEFLQWSTEWAKSDEGKAFSKKIEERMKELRPERIEYNVIAESDGNFRILDVLPGEYMLSSQLRKSDTRGYPDYKVPILAELKHTFTVGDITEENQDIAIELGAIEFSPVAKLEPNKPLPGFSARAIDGGKLNLTNFRGKYLLLTFYMITGEEHLKEDMASLKRIQDDFASNERFAMMGLTMGGMPLTEELTKKFLAEQGLTWRQGIIDGSNYELTQTFKIQNWPHSFLIDPNGVLLSNGLKGEELYKAVAKALTR